MDKADENRREAQQDSAQNKQTQDQMLQDLKRANESIVQALRQ